MSVGLFVRSAASALTGSLGAGSVSLLGQMTRLAGTTMLSRGLTNTPAVQSGPLPKSSLARMPSFGEVDFELKDQKPNGLPAKELSLVQLYIGGCNHYWNMLPELAEQCKRAGADNAEIWATVRHLIVFAGYAPCLAATIKLRKEGVLTDFAAGKVGGAPGNAFELVYDKVTDTVRGKLHHWDPVLSEYIRRHLYGDVYSSPGLTMAQKQLLTVAFLGEANMHDQLYTHLIAAMRFGNTKEACESAMKVGFHMSPRPSIVLRPILRGAMRSLEQAHDKIQKQKAEGVDFSSPDVEIMDLSSVCIPEPPPKMNP